MIGHIIPYLSPAYVAAGALVLLAVIQVTIRVNYARKVKAAGGVHAPAVATNPISALSWLWEIGWAQAQDRLLALFQFALSSKGTPECPNCVEINVTGGQRYLFTQEPEHIKTVLTGKFAEYGKGPEFHHVWEPFLGDSIFTTDHKQWQDSRNLIRPMFIKNRVSDLHIFDRWTNVMMDQFPPSGQTFDIMALFYRLTIDVITDFLLGESINSLENPRSDFVKAFTEVQRMQMILTVLAPVQAAIPRGKYRRGIKVMEEFIVPFIDKTLSLNPEELDKISRSDSSFTFLHALARYTRDPKVIRDQIMAILLAGRDTTAATLSWCFHELAYKPAVYARLRAEVLDVLGIHRQPTYDDLKNMKYVTHVLNETLRLYPAVPFNVRAALSDSSLLSCNPETPDISIVAGDLIIYSAMAMQRRADLYPPGSPPAGEFVPERWDTWQPKPWQYVPFNGGPRICVGQNFALTEMAFVLSRIVQRFERLENRGGAKERMFHKCEIVGTPGRPVEVALFEAGNTKH